jgi:hypothetical protein
VPLKRRTAKRNVLIAPEILPEAVKLFKRGLELQKLGADEIGDGYDEQSPEREEYSAVWKRLNWTLLGLVGSAGPLDVYPGMSLDDGAPYYRLSYPHALELRALLTKELRRR